MADCKFEISEVGGVRWVLVWVGWGTLGFGLRQGFGGSTLTAFASTFCCGDFLLSGWATDKLRLTCHPAPLRGEIVEKVKVEQEMGEILRLRSG